MSTSIAEVRPRVRVLILGVAVATLGLIALVTTGQVVPSEPSEALLVQSSVLLVVLGSLLLEKYFTAPADALVNTFTALITILPLLPFVPLGAWALVAGYLLVVMGAAITCMSLQSRGSSRNQGPVMALSYLVASKLGKAQVVFSVVFLAALFFFTSAQTPLALALLVFWGLYLAIWPLGLPQLLSKLRRRSEPVDLTIGVLDRIDSPNIARVALSSSDSWPAEDESVVICLHDGSGRWAVPLFRENRSDGSWATFLITDRKADQLGSAGTVVIPRRLDARPPSSELMSELAGAPDMTLIGLVREGSNLTRLRIEMLPDHQLSTGQVVVVPTADGPVFYQASGVETSEESFGGLNYGSQIAFVSQIGILVAERFARFDFLPRMNELVFKPAKAPENVRPSDGRFLLGSVPGTGVSLFGDFVGNLESHTAVLGTTGSGKTEFAFDLVRHAMASGVNVICIDLTSQYAPRLADLGPTSLSISMGQAEDLSKKLFDVETGTYGAGAEKKVLAEFTKVVRAEVRASLEFFYAGGGGSLGLIELTEISNTKATLWITEVYLSTLLDLARTGKTGDRKTLVVVEEAHTVMPEPSFAGLGDFDSKGTIAKITQIALQGRKYGVGLLVLAQRTATVSKSVLTQCNTIVSFSCIDDTSINFLRNVYGSSMAEGLSQLPRLRAVASGTWVESDQPIAFDVPYSSKKAERQTWSAHVGAPSAAPTMGQIVVAHTPTAAAEREETPF